MTNLKAVLFPIPGNPDKASTAFSTIIDVNCTMRKYIKHYMYLIAITFFQINFAATCT
jgi:hypothetical protein